MINKHKLLDPVEDLSLVKSFVEGSNSITIYGEFEIEPFTKFSLDFQAAYWHIKYMVQLNGKLTLEKSECFALYEEKRLNVIWLNIKNDNDTVIECKDGDWFINLSDRDKALFDDYKLLKL